MLKANMADDDKLNDNDDSAENSDAFREENDAAQQELSEALDDLIVESEPSLAQPQKNEDDELIDLGELDDSKGAISADTQAFGQNEEDDSKTDEIEEVHTEEQIVEQEKTADVDDFPTTVIVKKDDSASFDEEDIFDSGQSDNRKWFYIGGGFLILLLIILFFVFNPFSSSEAVKSEPAIDPVAVAEAQKKVAELQLWNQVKADLQGQLNPLTDLGGVIGSGTKLSLLYVYNGDIEVEVFAEQRDDMGKFLQALKGARLYDRFSIRNNYALAADRLVYSTLKTKTVAASSNDTSATFLTKNEIQAALAVYAKNNRLTLELSDAGRISTAAGQQSSLLRLKVAGNEETILGLLDHLKASYNVNINKMSIGSTDKKKIGRRSMMGTIELTVIEPV
jgi:uncharacterized integral membrane protein